jgi:hypothetical protein
MNTAIGNSRKPCAFLHWRLFERRRNCMSRASFRPLVVARCGIFARQARHEFARFEMRHVPDVRQQMRRNGAREASRVTRGDDAVLKPEYDLNRAGEARQRCANTVNLRAIRQQRRRDPRLSFTDAEIAALT